MIAATASTPPEDTVTILFCEPGHRATKRLVAQPDGSVEVQGYDAGRQFRVLVREITGIEGLSELLSALEAMPEAFVIRGAPLVPTDQLLRRTSNEPRNFGSPEGGRRWVLIDFDKIPLPSGMSLTADQVAVVEYLVSLLPAEFHGCSYHYQLSSSAGFTDDDKASAHVWFWLSEPWPDARLKAWARSVNEEAGYNLIDTALFQAVQPHFTAAPLFDGLPNPFLVRSALVSKERDAVSIQFVEPEPLPASGSSATGLAPGVGFEGWLEKIGDHPGGDGFHGPIIRAIASYVAARGRPGTDAEALFQSVRQRVLAADRRRHDDAYVEGMASHEHIMEAIEGALKKFGDTPSSRRPSRFLKDVTGEAAPVELSGSEAHAKLSAILDDFLGSTP